MKMVWIARIECDVLLKADNFNDAAKEARKKCKGFGWTLRNTQ